MKYRHHTTPKNWPNLKRLLRWGIDVCEKHEIPISNHIEVSETVCYRKDFLAITERKQHNRFSITFSLTAIDIYGENHTAWKALMLHELCHTIRGCYNHGPKWKMYINKLNQHGYKINPKPYTSKPTELY